MLGDKETIYNLIVSLFLQTVTSIEDGWDFIDNETTTMTGDIKCCIEFKDIYTKKVWILEY